MDLWLRKGGGEDTGDGEARTLGERGIPHVDMPVVPELGFEPDREHCLGEEALALREEAAEVGRRVEPGFFIAADWVRVLLLDRFWVMVWLMQEAARDLVRALGMGDEQAGWRLLIGDGERRPVRKADVGLLFKLLAAARWAGPSRQGWECGLLVGDVPEIDMDTFWVGSRYLCEADGSLEQQQRGSSTQGKINYISHDTGVISYFGFRSQAFQFNHHLFFDCITGTEGVLQGICAEGLPKASQISH